MKARLLAPVAVLLLSGCSAGVDPDAAGAAPGSPGPAPSAVASSAAPAPTVVEVTYAGGKVTGPGPRVEVARGERVVLRFTSDVVEEIHVHGYDLYADLVPGQPAQIAFTADLPGSYEVELHEAGRPLYQLRVS